MCNRRFIISFVLTSLIITGIKSQQIFNYTFRHINQSDGLLHTQVNSIVQDTKGYIWILTPNGLQRYDGTRFVNYPFDLNNPDYIKDSKEAHLFADKKNNYLWIISGEIGKLDLQRNKFALYTTEKILNDSNFKFTSYTDALGDTALLSDFGLFKYNKIDKKYFRFFLSASFLAPDKSNFFFTDKQNEETWTATWQGLSLFQKKTGKIFTHDYNPLQHPLLKLMDKKELTALLKDSRHNFWISTGGPLFYKYNALSKKISTYSLINLTTTKATKRNEKGILIVKCFFEDNHGHIWIGTANGGLLQYDPEKDSFSNIINEETNQQGLHYNYEILCIFQDKEENIWLGTDKGINIFNPYRPYFQSIHHEENNPSSIPKNEIMNFIQAANGDIIAGTWGGGITVYDNKWNFKKNIPFAGPYEYNLVWSFVQNDDGNIWIGCQHGFIHIYNPSTGAIQTIHPPELNNKTIWCITKDSRGNMWMGLHDGKIAEWDKQQNKFFGYNDSAKGIAQVYASVFNIFFDSKQRCWVSTQTGFKQFDTERRMYAAVYVADKNNAHSISSNTTEGIEEYDDSTLLIGTVYGGLNFFNPGNKTFSQLTTKDGLPANTIHAIKKDAAGYVWFTTDYDLYKFKPADKKFIRFNIEPGIINSEFKSATFYPLQDGRWVACSSAEIICFYTKNNFAAKNTTAKLEITGFKVFDNNRSIDSLLDADKPVQLSFQQNFLTIEFALLDFSNLQQTNYYYRLNEVDKDWVSIGSKNFASYTNLEPGQYIFTVKAGDGNETTPGTSFKIIISPPFWKTGWFILLLVIGSIIMLYQFTKWRVKSIKAVEAEKLKVQQLNAEQYKNKLEMEQIINYFSSSLIDKNTVDDVLWDVAKNLIGRLGFEDCMIYLWNEDNTKMIQRAGYGPKGSIEEIEKNIFNVSPGQGVVGHVMQHKEPVLIPDTSTDKRYRVDEMQRLSEICVPVIYNDGVIGVIDSEHHQKNFFTQQHLQVLSTIAMLMANKIKSIESEQSLQQTKIEMLGMNEKLTAAKLEALRSQMNPHFIFNCLNSIDNLIQNDEKEKATLYLSKFAKLIRSILETSKNNVVPCWKDMETLKLYIELEELRCDKKFAYQINIADEIMNGDYKVPPLVIQPFVENAIHHGLLNKIDTDKKLMIKVAVCNHHIYYCIEDNGVGRAKAGDYKKINKPVYESMGMQITTDRINLFNQNKNGSVKITDLVNEYNEPAGTRVEVELINQS
jgi:ligand-binding sensor domain-containing protein/putative methionine-R-sulfoxide reductase with GAF domain